MLKLESNEVNTSKMNKHFGMHNFSFLISMHREVTDAVYVMEGIIYMKQALFIQMNCISHDDDGNS